MNAQPQLFQVPLDPGDVIYTPDWVARDMVSWFKPTGKILEPCAGNGAFMQYLPKETEWCEIQKGRDFFAWSKPVDWVFGNPPYRIFTKWLYHSMEVAENICYLIPVGKVFSSDARMLEIMKWGGVAEMRYYGKGSDVGFPFGFPSGAVYLKKGYRDGTHFSFHESIDKRKNDS